MNRYGGMILFATIAAFGAGTYFFGGYTWWWIALLAKGALIIALCIYSKLSGATNRFAATVATLPVSPAPLPETQPQVHPEGARPMPGETDMIGTALLSRLGPVFTPAAALMWFLTIAALVIELFVPQARENTMPFYGDTVYAFIRDAALPAGFALVILNGLSSEWGPENMHKLDLWSSRAGFWAMVVLCVAVLLNTVFGGYSLQKWEFWTLFGVLVFGWLDKAVNQGEARRAKARALAEEAANDNGGRAGTTQAPARTGLLFQHAQHGLSMIGPLHNETLMIVVNPNGTYDFDVTTLNEPRLLALAGEQMSRIPLTPPPQEAAAA